MSETVRNLLEIEPSIVDATGAAAVLEVLSEQLLSTKPAGGIWSLTNIEVDAFRHAIRTANSAIDMIDGVHRGVLEKVRATERQTASAQG